MHTQTYNDNDNKFLKWKDCQTTKCRKCKSQNVKYREWDSFSGGYTDYNYRCQDCEYSWWVDGPDS